MSAENTTTDIICHTCNKCYSTKESLSNHNRNIHGIRKLKNDGNKCKYCNKKFSFQQSKSRHEKTCNTRSEMTIHQEMNHLREQIAELQEKLKTTKRIDPKTFRAINKILMDRSYRNQQNNNTNSNNVINNYQILSLGSEEMTKVLTQTQKWQIMNSRLCSIEKIVEIAHCGELNQYKNIIITNLKDNFAYKYDDKKGFFITVSKTDLLDDVMNHRLMDIEAIYDELKNANKIDEKTKRLIQDFLDRMDNNDVPFYDNETKYDNFKTFKTDKIKILLYNNHDKITKDIALLFSDDELTNHFTPAAAASITNDAT
jgi:hypothetical protein